MRKALVISLILLAAALSAACVAGAREIEKKVPMLHEPATQVAPRGAVFGVSQVPTDTFYYGGTVWDAGDGRWEAAEPSVSGWTNRKMWTWSAGGFGGTPHSGQNMDGWLGVDNTADQADNFNVEDATTIGTCAASKVLFCGLTNTECASACYNDLNGTGYGNGWNQMVVSPSATHTAGDALTLRYDYYAEAEGGPYDYTSVILQTYDTIGSQWVDFATVATYDAFGPAGGTEGPIDLASYMVGGEQWRILFRFVSDGGWSDQDGWAPTSCGAFWTDNVVVAGTTTNWTENFEGTALNALPAGWEKLTLGIGDYSGAQHLGDLPVGLEEDPCVVALPGLCGIVDSVIILCDLDTLEYPHPLGQDNYILSPIIDLSNHPDLAGKTFQFERFARLPLAEFVFMYWQVRYRPACAAGGWSAWLTDNYVYYSFEGTSCATFVMDVSSYIPPSAEQVQLAVGVWNDCSGWWSWGGPECTYECNATPYFDNVTFATFGTNTAPYISMRELDYWQDQFAEDGTLNPASTADTRTSNYQWGLVPPIFGDSLVCRGSAADMRVDLVFRMAIVGPQQPVVHPFFTTWFPTATTGAWQQARMDSAEVTTSGGLSTALVLAWYMSTFHEADPIRVANALPELTEILPNNLFVPGTRIEYFVKSAYAATPALIFTVPDTTGGVYEEFEVLPMMRDDGAGSVEWPCLIVADHFGQRGNWFERNSDRMERHLATLGYDYDMFRKLGPSSDLRNGIGRWAANTGQIGGPGTDKYNWGPGATLTQFVGYKHAILNAGDIYGYSICQADTDMLTTWLVLLSGDDHLRTLWVSGDQVCRELNRRTPWGPEFLNNVLCASYVSWSYGENSGDLTYCLPMNGLAGGRIACGEPESYVIRSNSCPRSRYAGHNVIDVSSAAGCSAVPEIEYHSGYDAVVDIAAVSNVVSAAGGSNYKTLLESYDFCRIRTDDSYWPGSSDCGPDSGLTTWLGCVLGWAGYTPSSVCGPGMVVGVTDPVTPKPALVTSLGQAFPNPMNPTATIKFSVGTPGKVMLRIFDVSGRVIRTLVDDVRGVGEYSVIWDGKSDRGKQVASGVFFYQLDTPGFRSAKKIVILQ